MGPAGDRAEGGSRGSRHDRGSQLVPVLAIGVVIGVLDVVLATSFASLIFSGPLGEHIPTATGLAVVAAAILLATLALMGSIPIVGSVQDTSAALLALVAASVAARLPADDPRVFATVVLAIAITSLVTGAFFLLLGVFRLGNLVRFVPYPVVGGFLAGTGWLLLTGGLGVLTDLSPTISTAARFVEPAVVAKWLPGVAFAVVLLVLARRTRHPLLIPIGIGVAIALFYGILLLGGASVSRAAADGWLLGSFAETGLWRPLLATAFSLGDISAIVGEAGDIATILVVSVLALLLNASAIELAVGRDLDLNRELRAAGAANLLVGAAAGPPGYHALSLTTLAYRGGAPRRSVGVVAAGVCVVTLLLGGSALSLFPKPVLGGLIVFLGLGFLVEWLYDAWFRLPRRDYAIVALILVVVAAVGFLPAVAVGLVAAVVLFLVDYSRTDVVRHAVTGAEYRSNVDRAPEHQELLREQGEAVEAWELQGFVFFGTANALLQRVRRRARDAERAPLRFLVLDFRRVTGLDSSAVLSFARIRSLAEVEGFTVALTSAAADARARLERGGLEEGPHFTYRGDLDRAIEWCEERLLRLAGTSAVAGGRPLADRLREELPAAEDAARLIGYLERVEVGAGDAVIHEGEQADDLYFLESGSLTVQVRDDRSEAVRLRRLAAGTIVGEVAMYLGRTRSASVIADEQSVLYRLSRAALDRIEADDPGLAAALHRFLAQRLADRLSLTVDTVRALID